MAIVVVLAEIGSGLPATGVSAPLGASMLNAKIRSAAIVADVNGP